MTTTHGIIDALFADFARELGSHGLDEPSDVLVEESSDGRSITASRNGGALRLVWTPRSRRLTLEISHGPPTGSISGWLDLYEAHLTDSGLQPDQADFELQSAITYGLELLHP